MQALERASDRFTVDGGPELEAHLAALCGQVRVEVMDQVGAAHLDGLLLGGGYGRGEGGVLAEDGREHPYNDLEFYVLVRGHALLAERAHGAALRTLGHRLSGRAGLEIEFKVLTADRLRRSEPSMFFYDLMQGHRRLAGNNALLRGCDHLRDGTLLPLHDATRLLMNRCSGLLFSAERLGRIDFGSDEADFVGRNLAKLQLAMGDVILTAEGQYHWSCRERHRRLRRLVPAPGLPLFQDLVAHHAAGVGFKLRPVRSRESREALALRHADLSRLAQALWLWLENRRLGTAHGSVRDYALSPVDKRPETQAWRNRLVNARAFGPVAALAPGAGRHPRERLLTVLCLLLWGDPGSWRADRSRLQAALRTRAETFTGFVAAYERLWHSFN